jgi:hypothetical protein
MSVHNGKRERHPIAERRNARVFVSRLGLLKNRFHFRPRQTQDQGDHDDDPDRALNDTAGKELDQISRAVCDKDRKGHPPSPSMPVKAPPRRRGHRTREQKKADPGPGRELQELGESIRLDPPDRAQRRLRKQQREGGDAANERGNDKENPKCHWDAGALLGNQMHDELR